MIRNLRNKLHSIPELSFSENETMQVLSSFLTQHTDLEIVDKGNWFYAFYRGNESERTIAFRADMDAVCGKNGIPGHFCGHDGHSAVLAGFAYEVSRRKPKKNVLFIFQPAEETGEGALLCREILQEKQVSEIYGFHNIPGYDQNCILLLNRTFACASTGLEITILGTPSHAAYPENGKNPAPIFARLMLDREKYLSGFQGLVQMTVIGADIGSDSYGVSASRGTLRLTVRAEFEEEYQLLTERICEAAREMAEEAGMSCTIRKIEEFPATENDPECVQKIARAAKKLKLPICVPEEPFRWSEDFGYYLQNTKGAFFGIGDGIDWPQLHTETYQFPDSILQTGLDMFWQIVSEA